MFDRITGVGAHEIIIESPDHDKRLFNFSPSQYELVLSAWRHRIIDLFRDQRLRYVALFRNEGRRAGARISHPHSQLIATPIIPVGIRNLLSEAREHYENKERCVFCDLLDHEREEDLRVVTQNDGFLAFCPFASHFPFEIWVVPISHHHQFGAITDEQISLLSEIIVRLAKALSLSLLEPDLNLVLKTAPNPSRKRKHWTTLEEDFHWHLELIPRISRPTGFETATGMFINPTPPEEAAAHLRGSLIQNKDTQ